MKTNLIRATGALLALAMVAGCSEAKKEEKKEEAAVPVEVGKVTVGPIDAAYRGTATLEAEDEATVLAKTSGVIEQVLVEGYSEETELLLKGRTSRQAPDIDGQVYITAGNANVGDIVNLRITDSSDYDLIGEIEDN